MWLRTTEDELINTDKIEEICVMGESVRAYFERYSESGTLFEGTIEECDIFLRELESMLKLNDLRRG